MFFFLLNVITFGQLMAMSTLFSFSLIENNNNLKTLKLYMLSIFDRNTSVFVFTDYIYISSITNPFTLTSKIVRRHMYFP